MDKCKIAATILAVLTSLQAGVSAAWVAIQPETFIPLSGHAARVRGEIYFMETMDICLGLMFSSPGGDTQACKNVSMVMDLGSSSILVPNSKIHDQHTFGYYCDPEMNCIERPQLFICRYNFTSALCNPGQVPLQFNSQNIELGEAIPYFSFGFVNESFSWELGNYGILGLSPLSTFWNYVRASSTNSSVFQKLNQFILSYQLSCESTAYSLDKLMIDSSGWTINSLKLEAGSIVVDLPETSSVWSIPNMELLKFGLDKPTFHTACVSNVMNKFLYIENFTSNFKPTILNQLCGNEKECKEANSVMGDVDNIYVTLYKPGSELLKTRVILDPHSFIKFDSSGTAVLVIGDISEDTSNQCPSNTTLILGRLFFTKASLVIHVLTEGGFRIGLYQTPTEYQIFFFMSTLVIGNMIFIICALLILKTRRRKARGYIEQRYKQILNMYLKAGSFESPQKFRLQDSEPHFDLKSFKRLPSVPPLAD